MEVNLGIVEEQGWCRSAATLYILWYLELLYIF